MALLGNFWGGIQSAFTSGVSAIQNALQKVISNRAGSTGTRGSTVSTFTPLTTTSDRSTVSSYVFTPEPTTKTAISSTGKITSPTYSLTAPNVPLTKSSSQTKTQQKTDPLAAYGGTAAYLTSQAQRYEQAVRSGDTNLAQKLVKDIERVSSATGVKPPTLYQPPTEQSVKAATQRVIQQRASSAATAPQAASSGASVGTWGGVGTASAGTASAGTGTQGGAGTTRSTNPIIWPTSPVETARSAESPTQGLTAEEIYQNVVMPIIDNVIRSVQEFTPSVETAPIIDRAYQQMLTTIDAAEQKIVSTLQQQMTGVDPATQAALANLRETIRRQRENLMEDMNKRGLLQSGIWLEMEDRLNRGELTETQNILAERLTDLQNQLNQALLTFANMRTQATGTYDLERIKSVQEEAQRRQTLINQALQTAGQMAGQAMQYLYMRPAEAAATVSSIGEQYARMPGEQTQGGGGGGGGAQETGSNWPGYELVTVRDYVNELTNNPSLVHYDAGTRTVYVGGQPVPVTFDPQTGRALAPRGIVDEALRKLRA